MTFIILRDPLGIAQVLSRMTQT